MPSKLKFIWVLVIVFAALFFAFAVSNGKGALVLAQKDSPEKYGHIDRKRLLAADQHPEDWLTTGRDFGKTHFSPLSKINKETVNRLGFAWDYDTHTTRSLEATPIVVDGVMYTSGSVGQVYALNAKTGKELWTFDPKADLQVNNRVCCDEDNRGVAVWQGKVYVAALDGQLFALNAATGAVEWKVDTINDHTAGYSSTGAPEIAGHVVVIGNAGGDEDARGYVSGYDLATGKLAWRFFNVPGDPSKPFEHPELEMASKTWDPKSRWDMGLGGSVWNALVYDPVMNLVYWGTGNPTFADRSVRSPSGGDNLFSASIIAVNPDTGRMAWYYQETPGDQWDYDAIESIILTDLQIDGKTRKVLMQPSKNGFYYVLDRKTGELLSAHNYVPVTWADHVDLKTGRPVETANARNFKAFKSGSVLLQPGPTGGHNWHPYAYDPQTGLTYLSAYEQDSVHPYLPDAGGKAFLRAWDPVRGKVVWDVPMSHAWERVGVMATGGGLVFQGTNTGHFQAYDADAGKLLKDIDVGTSISSGPMTYSVDGVQYVAVMAAWGGGGWQYVHKELAAYDRGNEGRIVVFKLDGGPTPKPALLPPVQPLPQPPPLTASAESIKRGETLFRGENCGHCHVLNSPRTIDLTRLIPGLTRDGVQQIVLGGALVPFGMPSFAKPAKAAGRPGDGSLKPEDVDAIYDYLLSLSWDAYKAQQAGTTLKSDLPAEENFN